MPEVWWRRLCCSANNCQTDCCTRKSSTLLPHFWGSAKASVFPSELQEIQAIYSVVSLLHNGSVDKANLSAALRTHLATSQSYGLANRLAKHEDDDNDFAIFLNALEMREVAELDWADVRNYLSVRLDNLPTLQKQIDDSFAHHEYTKRVDGFDLEDSEILELRALFNFLDTDQDGIVLTDTLVQAIRTYVKNPVFVGLPERIRGEGSYVMNALNRNLDDMCTYSGNTIDWLEFRSYLSKARSFIVGSPLSGPKSAGDSTSIGSASCHTSKTQATSCSRRSQDEMYEVADVGGRTRVQTKTGKLGVFFERVAIDGGQPGKETGMTEFTSSVSRSANKF